MFQKMCCAIVLKSGFIEGIELDQKLRIRIEGQVFSITFVPFFRHSSRVCQAHKGCDRQGARDCRVQS